MTALLHPPQSLPHGSVYARAVLAAMTEALQFPRSAAFFGLPDALAAAEFPNAREIVVVRGFKTYAQSIGAVLLLNSTLALALSGSTFALVSSLALLPLGLGHRAPTVR